LHVTVVSRNIWHLAEVISLLISFLQKFQPISVVLDAVYFVVMIYTVPLKLTLLGVLAEN